MQFRSRVKYYFIPTSFTTHILKDMEQSQPSWVLVGMENNESFWRKQFRKLSQTSIFFPVLFILFKFSMTKRSKFQNPKFQVGNFRSKQFINFKMCAILNSMGKNLLPTTLCYLYQEPSLFMNLYCEHTARVSVT